MLERVRLPSRSVTTTVVMGLLSFGLHLLANTLGGYGYFRDELYYLACSRHLAAGYVDQPPFSIFLLALTRTFLGDSVFAIRLIPAIASGLSVTVLCRLVLRMAGGPTAMIIASLAFICSGQILSFHAYYSMNSLDILFWLVAAYVLVLLMERPNAGRWLLLGVLLGFGLLNKTSALWLGAGVGAVLLITRFRTSLKTPGPYLAAATALVLFSPYVIWNVAHGNPHLEFMKNASAGKYSELTRSRFLLDQLVNMNPATVLVALLGLCWYLFSNEGRRYRFLAVVFLTVFGILFLNPHSKAEYMSAAYTLLFAGGGVMVERLGRRLPLAVGALLIVLGAVVAPLAMPVLPVEKYIRYAQTIGVSPSTAEKPQLAELPQFFADMQGWEELAQDVSKAYLSIPADERATTVALVGNYGEAGALELYARKYPLPRVICAHNSYWFWGVGDTPITTFIRLGGKKDDYAENYGDPGYSCFWKSLQC